MTNTMHRGSCHCGQVRYEVTVPLEKVISCNCSICQRKGTLLAFAPADQFRLLSGEDNLTDYTFNKRQIHHLFCKTCGVTAFAKAMAPDGKDTRAINVRCLEGIDLSKLNVIEYNGREM